MPDLASVPWLSQVLHCQLSAEEVMFPVSVTQQSPAAVSMETYHVTLTLPPTQVEGVWEMELGRGREVQLPLPFWFGFSLRWNLGREGPKGLEESGKSTQSLYPLSPVGSQRGGNPWRRPACILGLH